MRRLSLLVAAFLISGCASTQYVGTLPSNQDAEPIHGRRLLVVMTPSAFGKPPSLGARMLGAQRPDTVKVQERVPLDSLGTDSYAA